MILSNPSFLSTYLYIECSRKFAIFSILPSSLGQHLAAIGRLDRLPNQLQSIVDIYVVYNISLADKRRREVIQ